MVLPSRVSTLRRSRHSYPRWQPRSSLTTFNLHPMQEALQYWVRRRKQQRRRQPRRKLRQRLRLRRGILLPHPQTRGARSVRPRRSLRPRAVGQRVWRRSHGPVHHCGSRHAHTRRHAIQYHSHHHKHQYRDRDRDRYRCQLRPQVRDPVWPELLVPQVRGRGNRYPRYCRRWTLSRSMPSSIDKSRW